MPAFIYVSGRFSKVYINRDRKGIRLVGFLLLFILFRAVLLFIDGYFGADVYPERFFSTRGAPWYLLSMVVWYAIIPYFQNVRAKWIVLLTVAFGLIVGLDKNCSSFFVASKTIVMFPFFLLGYYANDWKELIRTKYRKLIAAVIMVLAFVMMLVFQDQAVKFSQMFMARSAYSVLNLSQWQGLLVRLVWYVGAFVLIMSFLQLVPRKKYWFTYIGQRTLAIYILHKIPHNIMKGMELYETEVFQSELKLFLISLVLSVLMTWVSSFKVFTDFFRKIERLEWTKH